MYTDRRVERMIISLEYVKNGRLGQIQKYEGQYIEFVEVYPYKKGFYMLCTTQDTRELSYKFRKMLLFVDNLSQVSILGECELKNELAVDTCITQELVDANCAYEILKDGAKSKLFGARKRKKMQENIDYCSALASQAIDILKEKYYVDENLDGSIV